MEISHPKENIVGIWVSWYFVEMPREILKAWKNFLRFNFNFFSIPLLIKTLFSYWKRYYWVRGRGFNFYFFSFFLFIKSFFSYWKLYYWVRGRVFNFSEYFNVLFSNLTSRILG